MKNPLYMQLLHTMSVESSHNQMASLLQEYQTHRDLSIASAQGPLRLTPHTDSFGGLAEGAVCTCEQSKARSMLK